MDYKERQYLVIELALSFLKSNLDEAKDASGCNMSPEIGSYSYRVAQLSEADINCAIEVFNKKGFGE